MNEILDPDNDGRMPVLFVGHGSPVNAIEDNRWSRGFIALSDEVPRPAAILAISAHWYVDGTYITANKHPRTIHDFGGFPQPLYKVQYPAPGKVDLARQVMCILSGAQATLSHDWGLDHGSWSVLRWMFPDADVPVIQLSIDRRKNMSRHFEIGQSLAELRKEGVLILASGNVVHNLEDAFRRKRSGNSETPDWAQRFDESVKRVVAEHDTAQLLSLASETEDGIRAHPTPDHWLPLIYAAGASHESDEVRFTSEGFDWGSISMRNIIFK